MVFFCLGYYLGPYLEPPADPLHHLKRTYEGCEKRSNQIQYPKKNEGLWHYSMSSNILCFPNQSSSPRTTLTRIDLLHGFYWGLLMVGLFVLSKSAGLPDRWAFLSCLIAFLFFGTNRFSYFSYYSMAPSFSSLLMYWLWTATFFFINSWKAILLGLVMAVISLPILWVNHFQEAAFMGFITMIWLFWNINERIWTLVNTKHKTIEGLQLNNSNSSLPKRCTRRLPKHVKIWMKQNYLLLLFVLLFILPQFEFFQKFISSWFERDLWHRNQEAVFCWQGFHVMGKIWSYRINDTLGIMGTIPLLLSVAFLWPNLIRINKKKKIRILILGILPFVGYVIPLFNFIWVSNASISSYYRLCYTSMFWIPIAFFLCSLEGRCSTFWEKIRTLTALKCLQIIKFRSFKTVYFIGCLLIIMLISTIRSSPVYGKLDFILLETRPWWSEWKPMIQNLMKQDRKPLCSDPQTNQILHGVFYYPIIGPFYTHSRRSILNVKSMDIKNTAHSYRCIINLHGYTPSWVPKETGHWQWDLANTSLYYEYEGMTGEELKKILKEDPPKNCEVYY